LWFYRGGLDEAGQQRIMVLFFIDLAKRHVETAGGSVAKVSLRKAHEDLIG
jgi:hypothetical protein